MINVTKAAEEFAKHIGEFKSQVHDEGYDKAVKAMFASKDYHHETTNLHARIVVRMNNATYSYELGIQSNVKDKVPNLFCYEAIPMERLMNENVNEIMDTFFAKHVLRFILAGSTIKDTTQKVMEEMNNAKRFN